MKCSNLEKENRKRKGWLKVGENFPYFLFGIVSFQVWFRNKKNGEMFLNP